MEGALLYREVQGYGWPWPGMLIVLAGALTFLAVLVPFGFGMWQQLVLGQPWGDRPLPDLGLAVVGPFAILLSLLPLAVLFSRLVVEVRADGLRIELVLFRRPLLVPRSEVSKAVLTHIGPVGWGVARQGGRLVFRMANSEGVLIELSSGKKLVIGSEHPHSLLAAIHSMLAEKPHR